MVVPQAVSNNKSKKFVYLLQGSKNNVTKYKYLQNSDADLITLTYDLAIPSSDGFGLKNEFFKQYVGTRSKSVARNCNRCRQKLGILYFYR